MNAVPDRRPALADAPPRIEALATLPVFMRTAGRTVLLAGGTEGAAWKAELLLAAGAHVRCVAQEICPALHELAASRDGLTLHTRAWTGDDLAGVLLALCDAADEDEAARFCDAGRRAGVPVNVVDRPAFCDFQFGSIVNRSPLVVAISTDGAAPVFGQALRARIEAMLPAGFAAWARAAKEWRVRLKPRDLPFRARRAFWEAFTRQALAEPDAPPTEAGFESMLRALDQPAPHGQAPHGQARHGKVMLVGAGPGDPELLTMRAVRALNTADVVLYDDLVAPAVLDLARREAQRINVGKRGYKPSCGQDEISAMLVAFGLEGKVVARLKGGDPLIFGRANEEISALEVAGVTVEIIPGITAASAAAAALNTSLTERDLARRVQFVTAHSRDGRLPDDLDWSALADPRATTVVYMGVRTLPALIAKLEAAGLPAATPVVMVEKATWAQERIIASTLGLIQERLRDESVSGPSVFLIGTSLARARERQATSASANANVNAPPSPH